MATGRSKSWWCASHIPGVVWARPKGDDRQALPTSPRFSRRRGSIAAGRFAAKPPCRVGHRHIQMALSRIKCSPHRLAHKTLCTVCGDIGEYHGRADPDKRRPFEIAKTCRVSPAKLNHHAVKGLNGRWGSPEVKSSIDRHERTRVPTLGRDGVWDVASDPHLACAARFRCGSPRFARGASAASGGKRQRRVGWGSLWRGLLARCGKAGGFGGELCQGVATGPVWLLRRHGRPPSSGRQLRARFGPRALLAQGRWPRR